MQSEQRCLLSLSPPSLDGVCGVSVRMFFTGVAHKPTLMKPAQATSVGFQPLQGMNTVLETNTNSLSLPCLQAQSTEQDGLKERTWGSTAHKPDLKWSRAQLHLLSRFKSLPETHIPQNTHPTRCGTGPVPLALLQGCSCRLGHPRSLPGPLGSDERQVLLHHKLIFRNNSLPQFPCSFLPFPHCVTANALSGAGSWSRDVQCPTHPGPGDTVIIIIDFPVSFMFHRVFCWK